MTSPYRLKAKQVIELAIANCQSSDPKVIRKAIRDAYLFGDRENRPYQIWLSEQKKALEELGIDKTETAKSKQRKNSESLICLSQGKLKPLENKENVFNR